jgi:hypothetical protein
VLLVERGPTLGGSGIYAGFIWTTATREVMAEVNPDGDPELRAALVDGFAGQCARLPTHMFGADAPRRSRRPPSMGGVSRHGVCERVLAPEAALTPATSDRRI